MIRERAIVLGYMYIACLVELVYTVHWAVVHFYCAHKYRLI